MRLAKRIIAVALSAAMLVTGLYVGKPASAQISYTTNKVYISTDLVPEDTNIQVEQDGSTPVITTRTNVHFTLDCNVDCTWSISNEGVTESTKADGTTTDKDLVTINNFGEVSVPANSAEGTYTVIANGEKNIENSTGTTATCKIDVRGLSNPATGTITLDKELIEAEYADYDTDDKKVVEVAEDGKSLTVNGTVEDLKLYTEVTPDYLYDDTVKFESNNTGAASFDTDTYDKLTTLSAADEEVTLTATCGVSKETQSFKLTINKRAYEAKVDCNDIPSGDKNKNNYNIRLNEDLNFQVKDNEPITLNKVTTNPIQWTMKYGDSTVIPTSDLDVNSEGTIETPLGIFEFTEKGEKVNLKTPLDKTDADGYDEYMDQIDAADKTPGLNQITMTAKVPYTTKDGKSDSFTVDTITLVFSKDANDLSGIDVNFASAGLVKGVDYAVVNETIGTKNYDVYYFESGETGSANILDLVAATKPNVLGVRDFEESKDGYFKEGNNLKYEIKYSLDGEIDDLDEKYINTTLLDASTNTEITSSNGYVNTTKRTLTKKGTGYVRLHLEMTGKRRAEADCILRFVSSAKGLSVLHTNNYTSSDNEYSNNAVIHIRQGEADKPTVYVGGDETTGKNITIYDPFIKFEISETIKGKGVVATTDINSDTGEIKINGLREGKVVVTATSIVDQTESYSYLLYVNDETLTLKQGELAIDITDAQALHRMDATGHVKGHYTDIPLKVRVTNTNAGIPEVEWSVIGNGETTFATIDQNGILTTLKSTGSSKIVVRATSINDPEVYAEQDIYIEDVSATKIVELGEKVAQGETGILTNSGSNAGTAKVGETFTLEPKTYEPVNATTVDGGITWSSTNEKVATIDADTGVVTTLSEGTTVIQADYTSKTGGETTTFNLTVSGYAEKVTSITCGNIALTRVGATDTLVPVVSPSTVSDKSVVYEVISGKDIVSVTENGVVTALKVGTATIKITSKLTPTVSTTVTVTVKGLNDLVPGSGSTGATSNNGTVNNTGNSTGGTGSSSKVTAKGTKVKVGGSTYQVVTASATAGTVAFVSPKSGKSVTVPATVTIRGVKYKVTSIKANAFKGKKTLKSVTIGKNVKTIGKKAFYGCTKLTKVTIKSKVLKSVGAKAFAKGSKKITITVPKKKASAYKKLLKKAGISKKVKYKKK